MKEGKGLPEALGKGLERRRKELLGRKVMALALLPKLGNEGILIRVEPGAYLRQGLFQPVERSQPVVKVGTQLLRKGRHVVVRTLCE